MYQGAEPKAYETCPHLRSLVNTVATGSTVCVSLHVKALRLSLVGLKVLLPVVQSQSGLRHAKGPERLSASLNSPSLSASLAGQLMLLSLLPVLPCPKLAVRQ